MSTDTVRYTPLQRFEIAAWYESFGSVIMVQRLFRKRYGVNTNVPVYRTIKSIHDKAREIGIPDALRSGRPREARSNDNVAAVAQAFHRSPKKSSARAATELHMSKTTVLRVLKDFKMHPYMLRLRQEITEEDCAARFAFCEEMLELLEADNSMLNEILFSDEAHFHLSGEVNRHNCVYWSTENPQHFTTSPLYSPKLTVWMGVWKGGLIGPYFFEGTVSGASYLQMLNEWLLPQLRNIDEYCEGGLFFMQDGAPPHWHRKVRDWLNGLVTLFPKRHARR